MEDADVVINFILVVMIWVLMVGGNVNHHTTAVTERRASAYMERLDWHAETNYQHGASGFVASYSLISTMSSSDSKQRANNEASAGIFSVI